MQFDYHADPALIERESFQKIRQLTYLNHLSREEQQVAMRVVHSVGMPDVVPALRFSSRACTLGREALAAGMPIVCDVEMVKQGLTKRMVQSEPLCFLNQPQVELLAKQTGETRTMAAVSLWRESLEGSVVIIGNAPTALFRLLEIIRDGASKPALIIGMPVGFVGAAESKQALWDVHQELGVECMTLLGRLGGSAVSAAACNALLRCNHNEWY